MGLTGFILEAEIECKKIKSSNIKYTKIINSNLDEVFQCFENFKQSNYSVAWLDTKKINNNYRSIFSYGDFYNDFNFKILNERRLNIFSIKVVNNVTIYLFNKLYFFLNKIRKKTGLINYNNFFYPLDTIKNWYKLYGSSGFVQYQFIVSKNIGKDCILKILDYMNKNNFLSSLCVLKLHNKKNENYLSFPKFGYSLAMDFPYTNQTNFFLNEIDKILLDYGGRVYLTKDSRLNKSFFQKFYPDFKKLLITKLNYRIINFSSYQSKRHGIK